MINNKPKLKSIIHKNNKLKINHKARTYYKDKIYQNFKLMFLRMQIILEIANHQITIKLNKSTI